MKKICHHLAVAPHGAPPAEVGKSSVGSMLTLLIGKREKGEQPRRIHRPGDRILFTFCLACHSNSSRFRIACLAVNRLTGSRSPLRATPVCQSFSSPSKGRRGLVATLPPGKFVAEIFLSHMPTRTYLYIPMPCAIQSQIDYQHPGIQSKGQ